MEELFVYFKNSESTMEIEKAPLLSFERGPILGSYYINGELFGLSFLNKRRDHNQRLLYSIKEGENPVANDFSGLIPLALLAVEEYMNGPNKLYKIEEKDLVTEDDLSSELYEHNQDFENDMYAYSYELEEYLRSLGYDVSINRGHEIYDTERSIRNYYGIGAQESIASTWTETELRTYFDDLFGFGDIDFHGLELHLVMSIPDKEKLELRLGEAISNNLKFVQLFVIDKGIEKDIDIMRINERLSLGYEIFIPGRTHEEKATNMYRGKIKEDPIVIIP